MTGTDPAPAGIPRVAVIAIHGVADQKPNESNSAIASLLVEHTSHSGRKGAYTPFTVRSLHLAQHPVLARPHADGDVDLGVPVVRREGVWRVRPMRRYLADTVAALRRGTPDPDGELGYQFMRMQLRGHVTDVDARTYTTTVLEGIREHAPAASPPLEAVEAHPPRTRDGSDQHEGLRTDCEAPVGAGQRQVDVYEVHWADLSRPATGAAAFFGTMYQLLMHVATLGRQAVDDAGTELRGAPWYVLALCQRLAVWCLTLPIPLLNVLLLVAAFGVVPAGWLLGSTTGPVLALAVLGAVVGAAAGYASARERIPDSPLAWSLVPLVGVIIGAAVGWWLGSWLLTPAAVVLLVWWALGAVIVLFIAAKYQQLRAGAFLFALVAHVLTGALLAWWMWRNPAEVDGTIVRSEIARVELVTLWTMQMIFAALRLAWVLLLGSGVMLALLWGWAWATTHAEGARWGRGRAALRTGRLALALSAGAFLLVTIIAWAGIFAYTVKKFDVFANSEEVTMAPVGSVARALIPPHSRMARLDSLAAGTDSVDAQTLTPPEYFQGLIAESVTGGATVSLALAAAGFLLLLWMALPSIRAESATDWRCTNDQSRRMGRWLSRGLGATRWVTHLFFAAAIVVPLAFGILRVLGENGRLAPWLAGAIEAATLATYRMVGPLGALVAASAVLIAGLLVKFGGSALDVVLDVDNYLRTTPLHAPPRARICQRFVAVLRHVASDDVHGGARYDGVVIVAHSLGALIAADLLRFLERERAHNGDPSLARLGYGRDHRAEIPITLLTMGNPLRQLLTRFFPHRYAWVRREPDNGRRPLPDISETRPTALDFGRPTATALGVARWENAYRSGDYVGRAMWTEEWYRRNTGVGDAGTYPEPLTAAVPPASDGQRPPLAEYCIGAGAHTHYWDLAAPDIADRLDALIASAEHAGRGTTDHQRPRAALPEP